MEQTDRTYLEQLEQENAKLRAALQDAQEANQAKTRFLSNMSHDIRTPMNAIVGMTAIGLAHIDEKARVHDCLDKIQTASTHLMSLVNDVLDMSRIDSGRMTLGEEDFSLADLVHDATIIIRPQAERKGQTFHVQIGDILAENLVGDPLRLRQIIVNIVGNAVKYTPDGGSIQVDFAQRPGTEGKVWLDFMCQDTGVGMSSEFLEKIFLPFERVQTTANQQIEGTGLGMSIVKKLADGMGGSISVESQEGKGSCFTVHLPLSISALGNGAPALPVGHTVLVAESEDKSAHQISEYLSRAGLVPVHLESGREIVTRLTEAQFEKQMPCALLLGHKLADMSPLGLAAHARQLAGPDFPILLVTESDWPQMEYRAVRAGVNAFVPCPLFPSRLLETLSSLTNQAADTQPLNNEERDYIQNRVLLVEDNELNLEIALELLSMTGVQVEVAMDGVQAVEKFQTSPEGWFDLIFMDVQMPLMDGYEATRRIRKLSRSDAQSVWIVAMTANAFVEDVQQAKKSGMNEHISKPVDVDRLYEILRAQLKPRASTT